MSLPKAIIVDLDGTLCDHRHRLHWVDPSYNPLFELVKWKVGDNHTFDIWKHRTEKYHFERNYEAFYAMMDKDTLNHWCAQIIDSMRFRFAERHKEVCVIFVTGRPEKYWNQTIYWLDRNGLPTDEKYMKLFMRPDFLPPHECLFADWSTPGCEDPACKPDHRPSHEVKREIYKKEIEGKYDVLFCLEDNEECAHMYKSLGLTVLKVC